MREGGGVCKSWETIEPIEFVQILIKVNNLHLTTEKNEIVYSYERVQVLSFGDLKLGMRIRASKHCNEADTGTQNLAVPGLTFF